VDKELSVNNFKLIILFECESKLNSLKMETTMYEDVSVRAGAAKQLKHKMTLDFDGQPKAKKINNLLASPDLNICTLASPELERIIIQQNGMVTTTPTPTQFLFPRSVTEEQEAYARGFVDALAELHEKGVDEVTGDSNDVPTTTMTTLMPVQSILPGTSAVSVAQSSQSMPPPMMTSFSTTSIPSTVTQAPMPTMVTTQQDLVSMDMTRTSSPALAQSQTRIMQMKEEPQMVPNYNTPPLSPIDMVEQEYVKLDRKRARNRVAARKCRYRKLERIAKLEDRVKELTGQKNELATTATQLKDQVARLKQQIMEHVNSGCKVMLNSNLL
jgi:transcription factor AP-1